MAQDLIECPFCDRRVYRELQTSRKRHGSETAVEVNMYPHGDEMELIPDRRIDNGELDLSL
jgi:hypothetical protein